MSTFEQSRGLFRQVHFSIVEIDLPVVEGECTISGEPGFGTPLSCDQPSNATRTYEFIQGSAPLMKTRSGILRLVSSISETTAKLNTGKGLASRGTATIKLIDIYGKDPNPDAPAVDQQVVNQGSYLDKLIARNELTNKELRIKNYRLEADGSIDLENGAETRHYIIKSVSKNRKGEFTINCEDELSRINIGETVWPIPLDGFFRLDVNESVLSIPVDPNVIYKVDDTIRSGEELMKVTGVSDIGTGSAEVTVQTRGSDVIYTNTLSETVKEPHSAGDEIFVCDVSDDERIDDLLERILLDIGISQDYIPKSDWAAEIDEWHPNTRVNTLWIESLDTSEVLEMILTNYMIDMWFDPVAREIKISAISVWKQSNAELVEGSEIDFETVLKKDVESLRATRAYAVYDKRFLASNDSIENFKKASLFSRPELEDPDIFGEPKVKRFEYSFLLNKDSADLLTNRWVNRYAKPSSYTWTTQERKLNFSVGDVVDTLSSADTGFNGVSLSGSRVQVTSINPKYTEYGREYLISADKYEPVFSGGIDDPEIIISGNVFDINLYIQYAGAPSQPIEITFVFDGALSGSTVNSIPSIRAGGFPAGSKLIIILANGAELMARAGDAGAGGSLFVKPNTNEVFVSGAPENGGDGGTVFDAEGVDCDIYFSGPTPSAAYPIADGYILAPSGGEGGFDAEPFDLTSGNGGNGGDGRNIGLLGQAGEATGDAISGSPGIAGTSNRLTGIFGIDGANNNATGGTKGRGIVDSGATVALFGVTPQRYINGGGDHV